MSLETYAAPQKAYEEPRYIDSVENFDPSAGNEDPSAALLDASGAYSPADKSVASSADITSFAPPVEIASDASVSMTVSDAGGEAAAPEPKERESGWWSALSTIGVGMIDEVINHPLRVIGNAVVGVAIGAVAAVAIPAMGVVGAGLAIAAGATAGLYGAYQLVTHADDWLEDGEVIANADQHSAEEVAAARENLIDVGHGATDFAAGMAGGFVGSLNSVALKQSVEAGGKLIGDTVRGAAGTAGEYVAPFAKKVSGAADVVMTKAGTYAGVVGNSVSNISTPVLAKGAEVAAFVTGKVGAVAQPVADKVASATLTVGEAVAPHADDALALATRGADEAGQLAFKGVDEVTVAALGADNPSKLYMTIADGAKAQATKVMDFSAPYVAKVVEAAGELNVKAVRGTVGVMDKAAQYAQSLAQGARLAAYRTKTAADRVRVAAQHVPMPGEKDFADDYLASALQALKSKENITPIGYTSDYSYALDDLVVRLADGRVFNVKPPAIAGEPHIVTPQIGTWTDNNSAASFSRYNLTAKPPEFSVVPENIVFSKDANQVARMIYRKNRVES